MEGSPITNIWFYSTSCDCITGNGTDTEISFDPSGKTTCTQKNTNRLT